MANVSQTDLDKCVPLHRFSSQDICAHIVKWVLNDMNHKAHLAKTKDAFANSTFSGRKMIDLEPNEIKTLVKNDLSPFISEATLDLMFSCYAQWKNELQHPYEEITSKTAHQMAHILFHYPLNRLLKRIRRENIDGSRLIASLTKQSRNTNAFHIIVAETEWSHDEVRQILSVLFRHHTWTQSEFAQNWDRVWAKEEYNALSSHPHIISEIKDIILGEYDVEQIHYKIKHAQRIDEFSDYIINMVDEIMDEMISDSNNDDEGDMIRCIYDGIAECFIFYRESEDLVLELQHWVCNNCGNCNVNAMVDGEHTKRIAICILCGLSQQHQIKLKLKNHETYTMVSNPTNVNSVDTDDQDMKEPDEIDTMIKDTLSSDNAFNLRCPNQNNNRDCAAIMRLTKVLIKYKRWLYTIYNKKKGKNDIQRRIKLDIAKFVNDDEFQNIFMHSMEAIGIIGPQDIESVLQSIDHIMRDIADPETFLQLDEEAFVQFMQKHIKVSNAFAMKFRSSINKQWKRTAQSQSIDPQHINRDALKQIIVDCLKMMQTVSRSFQEALNRNSNGIACVQTFLNAGRKRFGKIIQKEGNTSLAISLRLRDTILYSLEQKAQSQQFGTFLSDLDMESVDRDYYHILRVHINGGDKTCIENCFRYFKRAVHYEDKPSEIEECISVKRQDRMHCLNTDDQKSDALDIEALRQHIEALSHLDIIHSYLVHSEWKGFVRMYSEYERKSDDEEEDDHLLITQTKDKHITQTSARLQFVLGVDHDHLHLKPVYCSIRDELLLNSQESLPVELFADAMMKAIKCHSIALKEYDDELICKYYDNKYNIIRNQSIEMRHILAGIVYTHFASFCTMFRATFRAIDGNETIEGVTDRHRQIYYYARSLREAVQFFGSDMDSKRRVYHGLSKPVLIDQSTVLFNHPISTTPSLHTARQFMERGIILVLQTAAEEYLRDPNRRVKYLSLSWLSAFPNEDEYLFYGEDVVLKICDIYTCEDGTLQTHSSALIILSKFQKMMNGEHIDWDKSANDMQTLLFFIKQKVEKDTHAIEKISAYSIGLFNYFCDSNHKIAIYNYKLLPLPLRNALFADPKQVPPLAKNTSNISLYRITTLFTKLEHLSLKELDLQAMCSDAQGYVEDILNYIADHAIYSLRKITLQSEKQIDSKESPTLLKIVNQNETIYRKHRWAVNYLYTLDSRHTVIFTKNRVRDYIASGCNDKSPKHDKVAQTQNTTDEEQRQDEQEDLASDDNEKQPKCDNVTQTQNIMNEEKKHEQEEPSDDKKHPTQWSVNEAVTWICSLANGKYERYKPNLIARECAGDDFEYLNDDELCRYEVFKPSHRREILRAIRDLLSKYNDDAPQSIKQSAGYTQSQIVVRNLLAIIVAIGEYMANDRDDLYDVCRDVANYRDVLGGNYNYKFMTSVEMKGNEGWTMNKSDVESYVINECLPELIRGTPKEQYDALLVAFSGHGTIDSIVCSDSKMIKHSTIRGWFESQNAFKTIPRFFCIDACRVTVKESKQDDEEIEDMKKDSGKQSKKRKKEIEPMKQKPSITVMGHTEGHTVAGGKVSKYLCKQWNAEFEANKSNPQPMYKPFGVLYEAAFEQVLIETPQKLTAAEYDRRIDRVVFVPKDRNRGAEDNAQVDGTAPVIDDDLRNVLIPQEHAPMNLLPHFFTLFNSGYRDNRSLAALTKSKLNQLGITMPFQQKELLRRVSRLTQ
eukprot:329793_1